MPNGTCMSVMSRYTKACSQARSLIGDCIIHLPSTSICFSAIPKLYCVSIRGYCVIYCKRGLLRTAL